MNEVKPGEWGEPRFVHNPPRTSPVGFIELSPRSSEKLRVRASDIVAYRSDGSDTVVFVSGLSLPFIVKESADEVSILIVKG